MPKLEIDMRLTAEQINLIRTQVQSQFGPRSRVWLFGSRLDNTRCGGDVDLYIEPQLETTPWQEAGFRVTLQDGLQLPVDTVVAMQADDPRPMCRIARMTGVML